MSVASEAPAAYRNAAGTRSPLALLTEAIDEVRSRRRLISYLVRADMKKRGADTFLGNFWWILDPLLQMAVYTVFITIMTRGRYEDYPLFIFATILPWKWFSAVVGDATSSVVSQERLIKQMAFPKIVLPISSASAGVVGFTFGLIPLVGIMLLYSHRLSLLVVLVPLIAIVQYVFTLAVAILVSALNVFFRDLGNVARHALRLWWYLSPGLYSLELLDDFEAFSRYPILRTIMESNPFAILFNSYRIVIYGVPNGPPGSNAPPDWAPLVVLLGASLVFLALATMIFKRLEPNFAKIL